MIILMNNTYIIYVALCLLSIAIGIFITYAFLMRSGLMAVKRLSHDELLNEMQDAVMAFNSKGKLVYANKMAYTLMGYGPATVKTVPAKAATLNASAYRNSKDNDEITFDDKTYVCSSNDIYHKDKVKYHIVKFQDVTADRQHYAEISELKKEAEAANLAKSMFLAHMSHEIRTPINSIIGMDDMILRESNEGSIREYAGAIMKSGKTLITLVNDLIEFSKIESGKLELNPVYFLIEDLFKEVYTIMNFKSEGKHINLVVDIDPKTPRGLYGDEIRIRQILTQLVDNAVKYTEKGSVSIHVTYDRIDDINLNLKIDVRDTGVGMKPEDLTKIFNDFAEPTEDSAHRSGETGLGITIVRRLLGLMKGNITVDSIHNIGTNFHLIIPQIISDPAEIGHVSFEKEAKKDKHIDFKAPKASILVVDDIKTNRTIAKLLVKNTGISFDESESGEKALEMVKVKHYDLILLDQRMPGLTGTETLKKMSEIEHLNKDVPVVALTADAEPGAEEFYSRAGFTEYMAKPIDPAKYETMLVRLIPADKIEILDDGETKDIA